MFLFFKKHDNPLQYIYIYIYIYIYMYIHYISIIYSYLFPNEVETLFSEKENSETINAIHVNISSLSKIFDNLLDRQ